MSSHDQSPPPTAWWAPSKKHARGAVLGAGAIVLALSVTSAVVWISPETSPVAQVAEVVSKTDSLMQERAELLDQVVDLKSTLVSRQGRLQTAWTRIGALEGELATANAKIADLEAQIAQLNAAAAASAAAPPAAKPAKPATPPGTPATPLTAPSKAQLASPASPYFGMYTEQSPFNWATLDATAAKIGAQPSLAGYFGGWDEPFRANAVTRSWQKGMLPLLTWESRPIAAANDVIDEPAYSLPVIINGGFDDYLRQYARDIVATGLPLAIRLDHEMNGDWYPWAETTGTGQSINGNSPGDYVKMWQHVHDIFQAEGANELVIWVWAPNRVDNLLAPLKTPEKLASLYPGDDYVDWVGMSSYLRPPYRAGQQFTFDATFAQTLTQLRGLTDKPILLAEVGASEIEGHKAEWVTSLFDNLNKPANADVIGFSWFNLTITSYVGGVRATNDWRIDSRADSLAAFRAGLLGPGSRFVLKPLG